jgi:hypothetical protein
MLKRNSLYTSHARARGAIIDFQGRSFAENEHANGLGQIGEQSSIFSEAVLALKHALNSSAWLVGDETNAPMRMASLIETRTFRTSRYLKHKP